MSTCKNCGAKVDSKFCPYCGTKDEEASQDNIVNTLNDVENISTNLKLHAKNLNNMFDIVKFANQIKKENTGILNDEELSALSNILQDNLEVVKLSEQSDLEFKEYKKKIREARRAIASGHCPECGANIKKNDDYCPKCGADCLMEAYDI